MNKRKRSINWRKKGKKDKKDLYHGLLNKALFDAAVSFSDLEKKDNKRNKRR